MGEMVLFVHVMRVLLGPFRGLREGVFVLFCVLVWLNAAVGKEQAAELCFLLFMYILKTQNNSVFLMDMNSERKTLDGWLGTRFTFVLALGRGQGQALGRCVQEAGVCSVLFLIIKRSQVISVRTLRHYKNLRT